jgi:DNA-directed RNA polymerase subunit H (RpoH/RPB5)
VSDNEKQQTHVQRVNALMDELETEILRLQRITHDDRVLKQLRATHAEVIRLLEGPVK